MFQRKVIRVPAGTLFPRMAKGVPLYRCATLRLPFHVWVDTWVVVTFCE